jgi:hypothetical protein
MYETPQQIIRMAIISLDQIMLEWHRIGSHCPNRYEKNIYKVE